MVAYFLIQNVFFFQIANLRNVITKKKQNPKKKGIMKQTTQEHETCEECSP